MAARLPGSQRIHPRVQTLDRQNTSRGSRSNLSWTPAGKAFDRRVTARQIRSLGGLRGALVQLLGTRNEIVRGGLRVVEIVATAAVQRRSGRVAIKLEPEKAVRSRSSLRKIDQTHFIVAVAFERNSLRAIVTFRHQREADIGIVEMPQRSISLGQSRT